VIPPERIRNFSIVAHIDHGKSTLADRLLEATHTIDKRLMQSQVLDSMELEREKGITIKARAVRLHYDAADGQTYALNLIDTPGHVDFTYEVSRSLQACEGAILVVDASQGIEAQTLANVHLAMAQNLVIIPVINKIDLPSADVGDGHDRARGDARHPARGGDARQRQGGDRRRGDPRGDRRARAAAGRATLGALQALVFDSHYDPYKGVVAYVRLASGTLHDHDRIRFMATDAESEILELGYFRPQPVPSKRLVAGEVGYVATGLKSIREAQVGDTLTSATRPAPRALPGYQEPLPLVFAGIYPLRGDDYPELRDALDKLHLNDAGFVYEPESSAALGFGFRCGFLGLLHMEIVQERLEREFDLDLIASAPSGRVPGQAHHRADELVVDNPAQMPNAGEIEQISEPWVSTQVITPTDYIGPFMELATGRRGEFQNMEYLDPKRVNLHFEMPLGELIIDFYDQLKSRSSRLRQPRLRVHRLRPGDLVKLDVLVNGEPVDALSLIVHRSNAYRQGSAWSRSSRS
jgi:GTP-binding protein LepA